MIRVLQVVTSMNRGGLETMIMNYYRKIDKTRVQFDFLEHRDFKSDYTDEILSMGGNIYKVPRQNPLSSSYKKALKDFFEEHKEYKIVHSHIDCMSADPLAAAKREFQMRLQIYLLVANRLENSCMMVSLLPL